MGKRDCFRILREIVFTFLKWLEVAVFHFLGNFLSPK